MYKRPMRIACINDQVFPSKDTDTEQILSSFSALGRLPGVEVTFVFAKNWFKEGTDADALASYYEVERSFRVMTRSSLFPTFRMLEKPAHAISALVSTPFREADIIYSRNLPTVLSTLLLSNKKVVFETFRPWPVQVPTLRPMLKWMVRHPRFLGAVTHSKLAGQSFIDIGMKQEKLLVAYNGIDETRLNPQLSKTEARAKLGMDTAERIVSYVGHVTMAKGLSIMLRLAEKMDNVLFVIVGSYGRGEVEERARHLANVRIIPWQAFSDTVPYLYASDVLFIPPTAGPLTKTGNTVLPIKTYYYMASGRTIFGPSTPDLLEILRNEENAVLVPPDDFDMTFSVLFDLLNDTERMNRIGSRAAQDATCFSWDLRARAILKFIEERLNAFN
jgi:glycosyltransferase involved in cell wall biosynthesis